MKVLIRPLCIAVCGGALFVLLGVPLPWTLGPIAAIALYSFKTGRRLYWPIKIRNASLILFGYAMGRPFTTETGAKIMDNLPLMFLATLVTVTAGLLAGYISYKKTGLSLSTCLLGCVPGGLSQMVVLAEEMKDTDQTAVTIMQTIRMLSVVFTVPFLAMHVLHEGNADLAVKARQAAQAGLDAAFFYAAAAVFGALLAKRLRLPTPFLLGPLLSTAVFVLVSGVEAPIVPQGILNIGQVLVGAYLGASINLAKMRNYHHLLPCLLGGVAFVLTVSLAAGYAVASLNGASFVTAFLSTAPGGLTEMGITALIVGADISTLTAYQLFRLLFIMLVFPYAVSTILKHRAPNA